MTGSSNGHLYSLDMMKFVAAIFITNSHFQPLYEGGEYCLCYYRQNR